MKDKKRAADDPEIGDLEAELKMKRLSAATTNTSPLGEKRSKVGLGVAGSAAYGNDSPLYGAMGFVRKSDKKFGLRQGKQSREKQSGRWKLFS